MSSVCKSSRHRIPEAFNFPQHCFEDLKSLVVTIREVVSEIKYMAGWRDVQVDTQTQGDRHCFQSVLIFTFCAYENYSLCLFNSCAVLRCRDRIVRNENIITRGVVAVLKVLLWLSLEILRKGARYWSWNGPYSDRLASVNLSAVFSQFLPLS